jgi:hypothetical protein
MAKTKPPKKQPSKIAASTWPRLDLAPPEHMMRDWGYVILANDDCDHLLSEKDREVVERAVEQFECAHA